MELTIVNEREHTRQTISLPGATVQKLLQHLHLNPETVLVVRNQEVLTETASLQENDTVEILSVVSGG